jgi:hypothetical protein
MAALLGVLNIGQNVKMRFHEYYNLVVYVSRFVGIVQGLEKIEILR